MTMTTTMSKMIYGIKIKQNEIMVFRVCVLYWSVASAAVDVVLLDVAAVAARHGQWNIVYDQ